mmetsp:Transcript_13605/g.24660  ORF Transcript_13605/g.24660 Transcript_13605/m.24660 type:complete len:295 (-) Transcript_13605:177-1061(-)
MRPAKDIGAFGRQHINEFSSHGPLGTVYGDLLLGIIKVFHIKDGVSRCKGGALAESPSVRIQGQDARLLSGLVVLPAGPVLNDLGLSHPHGAVAPIAPNVPARGQSRANGVNGGLFSVAVREAGQDAGGRARHGVVHPPANVVGRVRRGSPVANGGAAAVERPVGRGWLWLALVLVLRGGEFQTYSKQRPRVHLPRRRELPPSATPRLPVRPRRGAIATRRLAVRLGRRAAVARHKIQNGRSRARFWVHRHCTTSLVRLLRIGHNKGAGHVRNDRQDSPEGGLAVSQASRDRER